MLLSNKSFKDRFFELYLFFKKCGESDLDAQKRAINQIVTEVERTHVLYNHMNVKPLIP